MKPVHAQGYFAVSHEEGKVRVKQIVNFYYLDEEEEYAKLIHRPKDYEEEMNKLAANMQYLLDKEEVIINGKRVRPEVKAVSLEFVAFSWLPYITFIIEFEGPLKEDRNVYENKYEGGVAEYDYEVYWIFPKGWEVEEAIASGDYDVLGDGNILLIWCRRGDRITGYERFVWVRSPPA